MPLMLCSVMIATVTTDADYNGHEVTRPCEKQAHAQTHIHTYVCMYMYIYIYTRMYMLNPPATDHLRQNADMAKFEEA